MASVAIVLHWENPLQLMGSCAAPSQVPHHVPAPLCYRASTPPMPDLTSAIFHHQPSHLPPCPFSEAYICIPTYKAYVPQFYPSKGKICPPHNYTLWKEGCSLTLKFLGSIFSWVACFLPSGVTIPRKASELSRCCTMSLMVLKTFLPWPLTWSDCFISSAESMPLKCVK